MPPTSPRLLDSNQPESLPSKGVGCWSAATYAGEHGTSATYKIIKAVCKTRLAQYDVSRYTALRLRRDLPMPRMTDISSDVFPGVGFPFQASPKENGRGSPQRPAEQRRTTRRKTSGNRVLMYGRVRELALYRAAVLRDRGFSVITPETLEEATASIRKGGYDIAVLTYTLSNEVVQELAELIREYCPQCPLVVISSNKRIDREVRPDEMVDANEGPAALLAALHRASKPN